MVIPSQAVDTIKQASQLKSNAAVQLEIQRQLDLDFPDLQSLISSQTAGPSTASSSRPGTPLLGSGRGVDSGSAQSGRKTKKRRTLKDEISYWEAEESAAQAELEETTRILPGLLEDTQTKLQTLLSSAQELSLQRYDLADHLVSLVTELQSPADGVTVGVDGGKTLVQQMEEIQDELGRLEAGLAWVSTLERVVVLSEKTLSPAAHKPSPLAALPHYQELHKLVHELQYTLPAGLSMLRIAVDIRDRAWQGLKDLLAKNLLDASVAIKWPTKIHYTTVPAQQRRAFERAFQDLLYLQTEGDALFTSTSSVHMWHLGGALLPVQALAEPIALRFKYHFQGSRNTNRVDKPEWAFSHILDQVYEHQIFISEILQPLAARSGYGEIDMKSEFMLALFPILLNMLQSRIPKLLDHPALLAHTIYQAVVFDDAIRTSDFDLARTSLGEGKEAVPEWEGLTGVLLKHEGWYDQWLAGEKKFVDTQLHEIIAGPEAWAISDEAPSDEDGFADGQKPTTSARQIKSLIEQVTDRYAPLPALEHKLPFLLNIQFPSLSAYLSRISGSLDAFETLSSAFVRTVPGALSGNTRGGVHMDPAKMTGGIPGLEKLIKARLSAGWVLSALRLWADDIFFVEMSAELQHSTQLRWRIRNEDLLSKVFKSDSSVQEGGTSSVFDIVISKYEALCARADDMIVRYITVEVENDLKQHLTRRWDQSPEEETRDSEPDASLRSALITYTNLLKTLSHDLPPISISRTYRRITQALVSHIATRAVYSGWSKFSSVGGQALYDEIQDWLAASHGVLDGCPSPANTGVGAPWTKLLNMASLLRLPSEDSTGGPIFAQAMAAGWSDGEESLKVFLERVGIDEMSKTEIQAVLRRRNECWR